MFSKTTARLLLHTVEKLRNVTVSGLLCTGTFEVERWQLVNTTEVVKTARKHRQEVRKFLGLSPIGQRGLQFHTRFFSSLNLMLPEFSHLKQTASQRDGFFTFLFTKVFIVFYIANPTL